MTGREEAIPRSRLVVRGLSQERENSPAPSTLTDLMRPLLSNDGNDGLGWHEYLATQLSTIWFRSTGVLPPNWQWNFEVQGGEYSSQLGMGSSFLCEMEPMAYILTEESAYKGLLNIVS